MAALIALGSVPAFGGLRVAGSDPSSVTPRLSRETAPIRRFISDCNYNGIPDSEDFANARAVDINHNGVIDNCDSDSTVRSFAMSGWQSLAASDTCYCEAAYIVGRGVQVRYVVPRYTRVTMMVVDTAGVPYACLVDSLLNPGCYSAAWTPLGKSTTALREMKGSVIARIGRCVMRRNIAWRWPFAEQHGF